MVAVVNLDTCVACGACVDGCPAEAISVDDTAVVDTDKCTSCGTCVDTCPVEAINMQD